MRNEQHQKILDEICSFLIGKGYFISYGILNAKNFGVPQERIRFFLLASKASAPEFLTMRLDNVKSIIGVDR